MLDREVLWVLEELLRAGGTWLTNPYHNLSHVLRVWNAIKDEAVVKTDAQTWAVAALFHDWGHPGVMGNDGDNIERSCLMVQSLPQDRFDSAKAIRLIAGTQFPLPDGMTLTPEEGLLRDADFWHTATLNNEDWLQVQAGLAREFGKPFKVWLTENADYILTVPTFSKWGERTSEDYREFMSRRARFWANQI